MLLRPTCIFLPFLWLCACLSSAQDMNRNRIEPNAIASKAGSAVEWQNDLDAALKLAAESNKPILWYVPTVPGTFMDRKTEIDRYMKAGPFSWPAIYSTLNQHYIPLNLVPSILQARKYQLLPYKFVEPGFLILSPQGEKLAMLDHLTTLHPYWLFSHLSSHAQLQSSWSQLASPSNRTKLDATWKHVIDNHFQSLPQDGITPFLNSDQEVEAKLLLGMVTFRQGKQTEAKKIWESLSQQFPDHPLAWKAAMEAQGIGPFVRGFEVFTPLTPQTQKAGIDSLGSAAPPSAFDEPALWELSTRFLLTMQDESGGYFDSDYDFGGADSMPNIYTAVTSLVGLALIEAKEQLRNSALQNDIEQAIVRTIRYVADDSHINLKDRDEILWAQAYRVQLLAAAVHRRGESAFQADLQRAVDGLQQLQLKNGSWYHEYTNAFVTGTALTSLKDAKDAGAAVDDDKVRAGLGRLERQRYPNGAYPYDERREGNPNGRTTPVEASVGRSCICQWARHRWGEVDDAQLAKDIASSLEHHALLARALKYDNHTSTLDYGGFFFWYDMHARAESIAALADPSVRSPFAAQHYQLILSLPELDGCFVDSHELGRSYGTAMALLSLSLVHPK